MTKKPKPSAEPGRKPNKPPRPPLPSSGGAYVVQDGKLECVARTVSPDEAAALAAETKEV